MWCNLEIVWGLVFEELFGVKKEDLEPGILFQFGSGPAFQKLTANG